MNFAVVFGASLWSGYALPACHPEKGIPDGNRQSFHLAKRKPVQTKPATSFRPTRAYRRNFTASENANVFGGWQICETTPADAAKLTRPYNFGRLPND